jgi:hypothetical protein
MASSRSVFLVFLTPGFLPAFDVATAFDAAGLFLAHALAAFFIGIADGLTRYTRCLGSKPQDGCVYRKVTFLVHGIFRT